MKYSYNRTALELLSNLVKSVDLATSKLGVNVRGGDAYAKALYDMAVKID